MARIDKIIGKVKTGSKNLRKREAITLLEHLGFSFERHTRHTTFYTLDEHTFALNRHKDILHPKAIKDLRNILEDLLDE
jgi:hypothetical protein